MSTNLRKSDIASSDIKETPIKVWGSTKDDNAWRSHFNNPTRRNGGCFSYNMHNETDRHRRDSREDKRTVRSCIVRRNNGYRRYYEGNENDRDNRSLSVGRKLRPATFTDANYSSKTENHKDRNISSDIATNRSYKE